MSREELAEFMRSLSKLDASGVEAIYQSAWKECRYDGCELPPASAIQQLVATWKVLRKIRKPSRILNAK